MKIAFVSDFHGNWPATQALERDLIAKKVDEIYCLGDLVGKGPSSDKTFDWAFLNCHMILSGNWDYFISKKVFPKDNFYWDQLGEKRLEKLRDLPLEHSIILSGQNIRLFHGRPLTGKKLLSPTAPSQELLPYLTRENEKFDGFIYADFHRPSYRLLDGGFLINSGSIGNAMGVPKVFYVIVETNDNSKLSSPAFSVEIVSVAYDNYKAAQDAIDCKYLPDPKSYIQEILTGIYGGINKRY